MTLGSRIAVMKDGVLQQIGTPDDIYSRPANTYVAGFIGSPTMNFIAGRAQCAGATGLFSFEGGEAQILGVRPEHIALQSDAPWRGEVMVVEPTGADTFVVLQTGAGKITVRTSPQSRIQVGEHCGLQISAAHAHWFDAASGVRLHNVQGTT
jgi:multiple sugar transport system ATP-binding protein